MIKKKMKNHPNFLLLLILILCISCTHSDRLTPSAKDGYIDLSNWNFDKDGIVTLDGTWEFYYNKLYTPQDFRNDSLNAKPIYLQVPGIWNSVTVNSKNLSGIGYGTYRLNIKLKHANDYLGIKLLDFSTSYKLWINNNLIATNGNVSSNLYEIKSQLLPQIKFFNVNSDSIEIIVQVANNFHYHGGMWESISIGTEEQVIRLRLENIMYSIFLAGTLFILFIYHIWIYHFRKKEKASLWFGILCFATLIRTLQVNERILYHFIPDFNLNIGYRVEYLTLFCSSASFAFYFYYLFDRAITKTALKIISGIVLIEAIIILIFPTTFYTSLIRVFQIILYLLFFYYFILTFKQFLNKKRGALLLLLSWLAVLILGMNDILYLNFIINTGIVAHYAFFIFLVAQAYLLSNKIAGTFSEVEDLSLNLERKVEERTLALEVEKKKTDELLKKSDELLLNILPAETANELKIYGRAKAKTYGMVTVMFTDFKDFTLISERYVPELLVAEIDYCYSAFDSIIQNHGIEKIKTVGDAYMCASGIPALRYDHANEAIYAAIEIIEFIEHRKKEKLAKGEVPFEIRIGIHSGPVVAGVVGSKKFAYDIWGDTVNLAARMEGAGEAGKVNISGATYQLVKDQFKCTHRGKIETKHKGDVDMYFIEKL